MLRDAKHACYEDKLEHLSDKLMSINRVVLTGIDVNAGILDMSCIVRSLCLQLVYGCLLDVCP